MGILALRIPIHNGVSLTTELEVRCQVLEF